MPDVWKREPHIRTKSEILWLKKGVWHISELDYPLREEFQKFLEGQVDSVSYRLYEKAFDRIKQHSIQNQLREIKGRCPKQKYKNELLFLPYYPDQNVAKRFEQTQKKTDLIWDFRVNAPEKMKQQVFQVLRYLMENIQDNYKLRKQMNALKSLYRYCIEQEIKDIEMIELNQIQEFRNSFGADKKEQEKAGIVDLARKALFLQADEINWKAHVWYLERFYFEPERVDLSNPIRSLSFLEVTHQHNRELLKQYMRYTLGITNLTINTIRKELLYVKNFLVELGQDSWADVCTVRERQLNAYFQNLQIRKIQAETYNMIVMCILHFFDFLKAHKYIEKLPLCADYYLKKVMQQHHDRSVELETAREILDKLNLFPEELRLMYLHLWGVGLRISEVCTLKGDAYYTQGRDKWVQIYQIKMKNYKRIPIPETLYQLMKVYLKRHGISVNDYVFQNRRGGAYCKNTFRKRMLKCCAEWHIQNGEYIFRSHDYRHGIATLFYDRGVSLQGVRDYLGHTYEEMTRQYIDYMPKKLASANDEYFDQNGSLATSLAKGKKSKDGRDERKALFKGTANLPECNRITEKSSG